MDTGLSLSLADGQRWLICPVDGRATTVVAKLGRVMCLGHGDEGRRLYVAVSEEHDPPVRLDFCAGGSAVCCLPEPTGPDMCAVGMERIATAIASATLASGGLPLHAALAEYRGSGFVMAAPRGLGKSTASARLLPPWRSLCDDTTLIVRDRAGSWWAHPWPTWSRFLPEGTGGSWPVEDAVPLRAVFFLAQSSSDQLEPVNATQAAALAMESMTDLTMRESRLNDENAARVLLSHGIRAARALASAVPTYLLRLSLDGPFWTKIDDVLPIGGTPGVVGDSRERCPAPVESFVAGDLVRVVCTGSSMIPTLDESDLLEVKPYGTEQMRTGDVICFRSVDGGPTVVHRVVLVGPDGIRTRGDNNRYDDPHVLPVTNVIGRVDAAQSGARRRKVQGGWRGAAMLRWRRLRRGTIRLAGSVPHRLYSTAAGIGPYHCLLPKRLRPRLVRFEARCRVFMKVLIGGKTVAQYDNRRGIWIIRRPFRLFVNEQVLGRAAVAAKPHGSVRD